MSAAERSIVKNYGPGHAYLYEKIVEAEAAGETFSLLDLEMTALNNAMAEQMISELEKDNIVRRGSSNKIESCAGNKWDKLVRRIAYTLTGMHEFGFKKNGAPARAYADVVRVALKLLPDPVSADDGVRAWDRFYNEQRECGQWQYVSESNAAKSFGRWLVGQSTPNELIV